MLKFTKTEIKSDNLPKPASIIDMLRQQNVWINQTHSLWMFGEDTNISDKNARQLSMKISKLAVASSI